MTKQEIKVKAVDQALEYAKHCIHQQLKTEEFMKLVTELNNFYNGKHKQ